MSQFTSTHSKTSRALWPLWARFLQQKGLVRVAADVSDAAGPLAILGAQLLHLGQPLISQVLPTHHLEALALLLEDQKELKQFALYLREARPH